MNTHLSRVVTIIYRPHTGIGWVCYTVLGAGQSVSDTLRFDRCVVGERLTCTLKKPDTPQNPFQFK